MRERSGMCFGNFQLTFLFRSVFIEDRTARPSQSSSATEHVFFTDIACSEVRKICDESHRAPGGVRDFLSGQRN